jgi:glutamate synthase domain-containing protein 3
VRNSGAYAVVEGIGDHGCEYMTGGRTVVLGKTGRNFAAGMSGGIAYVYDEAGTFKELCNQEMVMLEKLEDSDEADFVKTMITKHVSNTGSPLGRRILDGWDVVVPKFVKVMPVEYKRTLMLKEVRGNG